MTFFDRHRTMKIIILLFALLVAVPSPAPEATLTSTDVNANQELVILLHGFGRSKASMWLLGTRIRNAGFQVQRLDYRSIDQSPQSIVDDIAKQIDDCCAKHKGKIHFVGYSFGGLLVRAFLQQHRPEQLGRVTLIATPNQGTPLVDFIQKLWLPELWLPPALQNGKDINSFAKSLPQPNYSVGVIAAQMPINLIPDIIAEDNDGLVPVESTRLSTMDDFIVITASHDSIHYNDQIAKQTIHFLKDGQFDH